MDVIEKAVSWAVSIAQDAAHGYSQANRWGPDYDCSSLVISAWKQAGLPLTCQYTGSMKADFMAKGFRLVLDGTRQRGDVLLSHNDRFQHTAMMINGTELVQASHSENGGIYGDTGDQLQKAGGAGEINIAHYYTPSGGWDCVLRYSPAVDCASKAEIPETYTVQGGDSLYRIAEQFGLTVYDIANWNAIKDPNLIYKGAVLRLTPPESEPAASNEWDEGLKGSTDVDTYIVQPGDTLSGIAYNKYGRWSYYFHIKKYNGLTSDTIYPGQKIILPSKNELLK